MTVCGDGARAGLEECDDGNGVDGDGCSSACAVETGWTCSEVTCEKSVCEGGGCPVGFSGSDCAPCKLGMYGGRCEPCMCNGNGRCLGSSGECECFAGFEAPDCTTPGPLPSCGDGWRYRTEQCDDGNNNETDGCPSIASETPCQVMESARAHSYF